MVAAREPGEITGHFFHDRAVRPEHYTRFTREVAGGARRPLECGRSADLVIRGVCLHAAADVRRQAPRSRRSTSRRCARRPRARSARRSRRGPPPRPRGRHRGQAAPRDHRPAGRGADDDQHAHGPARGRCTSSPSRSARPACCTRRWCARPARTAQPYELLAGQRRFAAMQLSTQAGEAPRRVALHARRGHLAARGADDAVRRELPPEQARAGAVRPRGAADHGRGPVADRRRGVAHRRRPAGLDAQGAAAARAARRDRRARRARRPLVHRRRLRPPRRSRAGTSRAEQAEELVEDHANGALSGDRAQVRRRLRPAAAGELRGDLRAPRRRPPRGRRGAARAARRPRGARATSRALGATPRSASGPSDADLDGYVLGAFLFHSATDRRASSCGSRARPTRTSTLARCTRTSACSRCARSPAK